MNIGRFLFISVNAEPITPSYKELKEENPGLSLVWKNYCKYLNISSDNIGEDTHEICWLDRAQQVPEFSKINFICLGFLSEGKLRTKELKGDEKSILIELNKILDKVQENEWVLCGWNIKNYDVPLLNKRFLINKVKPHSILPKADTKPWEMKQLFDLKEYWNGNSNKGINSIDALYYSVCYDKNIETVENNNPVSNVEKMFNIIKEFSDIE